MSTARVAIVHLSDIHLKAEDHHISRKVPLLDAAIRSEAAGSDAVILVLTGDIAYSGAQEEYQIASSFLSSLVASISTWVPRVETVIVPGNHDCDFRIENRIRSLVLDEIDTLLADVDSDRHDVASQCLGVQESFFAFATPHLLNTVGDRLHFTRVHDLGGEAKLRFECFNTAWLSRRREEQGQIRVPEKVSARLRNGMSQNGEDFVVTIFHHPYSWFGPTNRREFQAEIERHSDLVLTGHEHVADSHSRLGSSASSVQYIEGGVLHGEGQSSAFNIVKLNFDAGEQEVIRFELHSGSYRINHRSGVTPLTKNHGAFARRFTPNDEFSTLLLESGRHFKHPRMRDLRLRDLFIYPDLRQRLFERRLEGQKSGASTVHSENVLEYIVAAKRVLIIGPDESGKSALARSLYSDLRFNYQLVPVMIRGEEFRGHSEAAFRQSISRAIKKQYNETIVEEYAQLSPDRKVLIIDDFQSFAFNSRAQARLLREAEQHFDQIIAFADDLFRYEELSAEAQESNPFATYEHCDIKPLGFRLRRQLIRKWVLLGQEYRLSELQVFQEIERREQVVDHILKGDLIPPHPLFVLLVLQAGEIDPNQAVSSGTYGYLNDFLIMRALANVSKELTDIGTLSAYLSHLAYAQFLADGKDFTTADFDIISTRYVEEYGLVFSARGLLDDLSKAQILSVSETGIGFRYRIYYFYFVAKYFRDKIDSGGSSANLSELRAQLREIADNIYFDPYVSILTFYLYFKKDEELIGYLLGNAKAIYAEYEPCDLDDHVKFLNGLYEQKPKRNLPDPRPEAHRESVLRGRDSERSDDGSEHIARSVKLKYSKELKDYLKVNIALKTMQVLGQVLKDSPGQLPAKLKADIAEECYSIGLRTLRAVFLIAESNLEAFREAIEDLIKERRADARHARVPRDASQFVIWLCLGAALGVIRRISRSVGHVQLEKTYSEVLRRFDGKVSAELIDMSIRIEQFHQLTRPLVEGMVQHRLRDNIFGYQIVQDLVYNYFASFPSEREHRQKICGVVGITSEDPRFFDSRLKKLGPGDSKGT